MTRSVLKPEAWARGAVAGCGPVAGRRVAGGCSGVRLLGGSWASGLCGSEMSGPRDGHRSRAAPNQRSGRGWRLRNVRRHGRRGSWPRRRTEPLWAGEA